MLIRTISIHAPRVGCDQSTSAARLMSLYFNPRTPCGVRHVVDKFIKSLVWISIHAPRVGCDMWSINSLSHLSGFQSTHPVWGATKAASLSGNLPIFQSTHPVWGATRWHRYLAYPRAISIHAPRVGCDYSYNLGRRPRNYFNPRTPCGVRLLRDFWKRMASGFQSTHPVWGATRDLEYFRASLTISIHAPRVGCDFSLQ